MLFLTVQSAVGVGELLDLLKWRGGVVWRYPFELQVLFNIQCQVSRLRVCSLSLLVGLTMFSPTYGILMLDV